MSLFGTPPLGSTNGHRHYVEMKAGKMTREGTWVLPDRRKGLLYIYQNSEPLMHFCWKDRVTYHLEDDLIIFPGDCTYSRVRQCKTGRVYVLKFNNSLVRKFYWLQEPKTDKDDEHCKRINYLLNHPPVPLSVPGMYAPHMLTDMSQTQLSRIFGPSVAATLSTLLTTGVGTSSKDHRKTEKPLEEPLKHNTTPTSNSVSDIVGQENKRSNLKQDDDFPEKKIDSEKEKKEKSVTILEDVQITDIDEEDDYYYDEDEDDGHNNEHGDDSGDDSDDEIEDDEDAGNNR